MPKKAFLVEFSVATSVVVDVPEDKLDKSPSRDDELFALVADAAVDHIISNGVRSYLHRENIESIKNENISR